MVHRPQQDLWGGGQMLGAPMEDLGTIGSTEPLAICKDNGGKSTQIFAKGQTMLHSPLFSKARNNIEQQLDLGSGVHALSHTGKLRPI
jgi:hypothetical protein